MESLISRYWWGGDDEKHKIHWDAWQMLCKPKSKGGMSFQSMREFNEALLAKQGWRIMQNGDSLVARVLEGKYFLRKDF